MNKKLYLSLGFFILLNLFKLNLLISQILERKTLTRCEDPVIIQGKYLQKLSGAKIKNLCLYSYKDGKFIPIPFQIDKKDKEGNYIFSDNKKENLEIHHELVFAVKDSGDCVLKNEWKEGYIEGLEIQIKDPLTSEKAWVYLLYFPEEPEKSKIDYVEYLREEEKIVTTNYIVGFSKDNPLIIDHLAIKEKGGGDGENRADRFKIRFKAKTYFGITIKISEEDLESEITGIIDGPVRIIRKTKNVLNFYKIFKSPSAESSQIYYYNFFIFPVVINVPFDISKIFTTVNLRITFESKEPTQRIFYNSNNKKGVILDGIMNGEEKNLDKSPYVWSAVKEPTGGAWISRLLLKNDFSLPPSLYYLDNKNILDPPENFPGQVGNVGYELSNFQKIKEGFHQLISIMHNLENYNLGDEKKVLDILDNPLEISVRMGRVL